MLSKRSCNLRDLNCVPKNKHTVYSNNGNINVLQKENGRIAKIVGKQSGADKGDVQNIKFKNKFYFLHTALFNGPKITDGILKKSVIDRYINRKNDPLSASIREIKFLKKAQNTTTVPKIFINELLYNNRNIKLILATNDLTREGYNNVAHYLDNGLIKSISFLSIEVSNQRDRQLERFLKKKNKDTRYSAFFNPKYCERNFESWFKYNIKFLTHLFKSLYKLHQRDIFHHDLHAGNVWYNGKKVMFIDFGRASTEKESFKKRRNEMNFLIKEKSLFSKEKNKKKRFMLAELSKDPLNPSGRHEFFRHDIDDKIMVEEFYYSPEYYNIVHKFKLFLSRKYCEVNK